MLLQLKENGFLLRLLVLWMLLIFPRLTLATASTPMDVIQSNTDKVLAILHESKTGQTQSLRQREGEILDVVSNYFGSVHIKG